MSYTEDEARARVSLITELLLSGEIECFRVRKEGKLIVIESSKKIDREKFTVRK